jgi:hypothetical protein
MNFEEWVQKQHSDFEIEEGWKDWAKKAAVSGALLGAGLGIGKGLHNNPPETANQPIAQNQTQPTQTDIMRKGDQIVVVGRSRIIGKSIGQSDTITLQHTKKDAMMKVAKLLKTNNFPAYGMTVIEKKMENGVMTVKYRLFLKQPPELQQVADEMGDEYMQPRNNKTIMPQSTTSQDAGDFL